MPSSSCSPGTTKRGSSVPHTPTTHPGPPYQSSVPHNSYHHTRRTGYSTTAIGYGALGCSFVRVECTGAGYGATGMFCTRELEAVHRVALRVVGHVGDELGQRVAVPPYAASVPHTA
eukprot:474223-Rhodomonas_salina.3